MDHVLEHLRGLSGYNRKGEEVPDPRPTHLQVDIEAEMPLDVKIMRALRSQEWQKKCAERGIETWEEANDFDIPTELPEFRSVHEDESGDVIAFEEGLRSGFIEEIPIEKKESAHATKKAYEAITQRGRKNAEADDMGHTSDDLRSRGGRGKSTATGEQAGAGGEK